MTDDATLIKAVRILARDIVCEDGVATACLSEVADRLEERRWIPVGERLPELNHENDFRFHCLACCKGGLVYEMVYEINTFAKHERHRQPRWKWHGTIAMWEVTHWQPLPRGADRE